MTRLVNLFSGSRGNCTLITYNNTNILVDAGLSDRHISMCLATLDMTPDDINGIVVTHEHGDHVSALAKWSRHNTPIYAQKDVAKILCDTIQLDNIIATGKDDFAIGDLLVRPVPCSHDSSSCVAYTFFDGSQYTAVATDTGIVSKTLLDQLCRCTTVLLESNHDVDMVKRGDYPYMLKKRILSNTGHLSNQQACDTISQLLEHNVKNIVLGHLSHNNNTAELAFNKAISTIKNKGLVEGKDVRLYVASQYIRGDIIE